MRMLLLAAVVALASDVSAQASDSTAAYLAQFGPPEAQFVTPVRMAIAATCEDLLAGAYIRDDSVRFDDLVTVLGVADGCVFVRRPDGCHAYTSPRSVPPEPLAAHAAWAEGRAPADLPTFLASERALPTSCSASKDGAPWRRSAECRPTAEESPEVDCSLYPATLPSWRRPAACSGDGQ